MKKSPKKTIKKRMTINDLAETMDNLARMVAKGFEETKAELRAEFNRRMDKMEGKLDINIAQTAEGFQGMRDRFDDLDKRFDVSEAGTHRRITLVESTVAGMMKREVKK